MVRIRYLPTDSALYRKLAGDNADLTTSDHLLAHIGSLLAGANWQRGGGKGSRPKPIKIGAPPTTAGGKPAPTRQEKGDDYANRLKNLGLIPT